MGNLSKLTGAIKLNPPLTRAQALDIASKVEWNSGQADWTLAEDFGAICPVNEGWWKQYDARKGLEWWLAQLPPDTTASGLVLWEYQEGGSVVITAADGDVTYEATIEIESASAFIEFFGDRLGEALLDNLKNQRGADLYQLVKETFKTALKTYKNPQHKTPEHVGYICDWAAEQRDAELAAHEDQGRADAANAALKEA